MIFGIFIKLPFTQQQHKKDETYRYDTLCDSCCKSIRDCTFCSGRNFECDLFADRIHLEGNFLAFARAVELCHKWRTRCLVSVKHTKKEAQIHEKRERNARKEIAHNLILKDRLTVPTLNLNDTIGQLILLCVSRKYLIELSRWIVFARPLNAFVNESNLMKIKFYPLSFLF